MDTAGITTLTERDVVFGRLVELVADIVGEDVVEEIGISSESLLTRDIEMDSIQIVAFAERVKREWGDRVDFIAWLSGMTPEKIYLLSVGQVVDLITQGER
jgi:acyl carrier protein